ncbi:MULTISPECIES: choice-of-anchor H family protein [Alteromonadaceae]|uniref:choice-of-anchor H family protein n=1 Tax=Alteromonadaceae TaxID=72275 RepID=UPI001C091D43|nr:MULTISPECIES: choice-of-anchor H family protein [Aliiglaciecola]MBU2878485.1 choice-of-anchor H family protein [Aliiglaciecola lipolytica]MDO6709699.1 choice-of-anchor H family protein [Aliiglaciecola sp. 2_MG-2023]MDO6750759.1 choice-of-anchor H family protein [Aliiglaciecola sp. 1_MG-2023]
MTRFTLISTFSLMFSIASFSALSAQSDTTESISVTSTESQYGSVLAQVNKKGVPGSVQKQSMESVSLDKAEAHKMRQAAAPLTRPLDRDLRMVEDDPDFWIYDATVFLDIDRDADGYYSGFTLEFDADTIYTEAEVYARLYLARGDVFEEYHTTSLFFINGDSSSDSYVIESDLQTGFPPGDYELLIELYDTYDNRLVAISDGYSDADLSLLTLESQSYEQPQVIIVTEHGGSFGFLTLLLIPILMGRVFFTRS